MYRRCLGLIYYCFDAYLFVYYPLSYLVNRRFIHFRTLVTQGPAGKCCPQVASNSLGQAFSSVSGE